MVEAISGYRAGVRFSGGVIDAARVQANRAEAFHERNRLLDVSTANVPTADRVSLRAAAVHGREITAADLNLARDLPQHRTLMIAAAMAYNIPFKPH